MSEEERKAIEDLKKGIEILNLIAEEKDEVDIKTIDIVLNLIEKQQKEIERLKFSNYMVSKWNEYLDKECISKNKIREKIEKYEKDYIRQDKEELFNLTKITAGALSALQELLEEK